PQRTRALAKPPPLGKLPNAGTTPCGHCCSANRAISTTRGALQGKSWPRAFLLRAKPVEALAMPHAIRVHEVGGPDVLQWEEIEVGEPAEGKAKLRQEGVWLNFSDVSHPTGLYTHATPAR